MWKILDISVCFSIVALDVIGGMLGLKDDVAQYKENHLKLRVSECQEPSHESVVLGLAATILLGIAHVLATLYCGWSVCNHGVTERASPTKKMSIGFFFFYWISLIIGLTMLVMGVKSNNKSKASCGVTYDHALRHGGILCMIHAFCAVGYCATATSLINLDY
ncbi:hypothetical protein SASPL_130004 [Salvia splendens]|uniref:Uncharacterized protein n=1 Tax=Salvia splendens TaxID=180675 RepID=A0A8X8ZK86_SALSN|nr:hypothetical protein SASPL_130004 [Salvia splendens]